MRPKQFVAPKILLFGGEKNHRLSLSHIISEYVQNSSYRIFDTDLPGEARNVFEMQHPDLVILEDSANPADVIQLCKYIRATEGARHTGIVFRSHEENFEDETAARYLGLGADDFIRPGCSPAELNARLRSVLKLKDMNDKLRSLSHHFKKLSSIDELTGLANMRSFKTSFERLRSASGNSSYGVIMLDLDNFKSVNDNRNHLVGSHVISEVGKIFGESISMIDLAVAARYGGDEYVIALPVSSPEELSKYCEKIRREIEFSKFNKDGYQVNVTCSIGGAYVEGGCLLSDDSLLKAADKMLYSSKNSGRNRSTVCYVNNFPRKPVIIRNDPAWKIRSLLAVV
jgi:two-component system, cell cycle response regulator